MDSMKAAVYKKYGGPEVLEVTEVAKPVPSENEILVKVYATEVTKADCELRRFKFPVKWFAWLLRLYWGVFKPRFRILGSYVAGVVESVGSEVTKFRPGDEIFGATQFRFGGYGEYVCLPENSTIIPKPVNFKFEQSAAIPLGALNAFHFIDKASIEPGNKVLIIGAGGSIGLYSVQLAKYYGAEVTVVDSHAKKEMLESLGVDHFVDYQSGNLFDKLMTYDAVFNMVPSYRFSRMIKLLKPGGRYLMGNPKFVDFIQLLITNWRGEYQAIASFAKESESELEAIREFCQVGVLAPVLDKVFKLDDIVKAHQRVETEKRAGIVILSFE